MNSFQDTGSNTSAIHVTFDITFVVCSFRLLFLEIENYGM